MQASIHYKYAVENLIQIVPDYIKNMNNNRRLELIYEF